MLHLFFFFVSFGNRLSDTDLIFRANINSASDNPELVPGFHVTRYSLGNCIMSLTRKSLSIFMPVHKIADAMVR